MTFTRNGLRFTSENEFNEWAVNEVELIINNTQLYYSLFHNITVSDKRLINLIKEIMINRNIKIKQKNIIKVFNELRNEIDK